MLFDYATKLYFKGCESLEALYEMDIEQIIILGMWMDLYDIRQGRLMGFLLPKGYNHTSKGSSPDKWQSGRWQENIGSNRIRIKTRVNVMDLWDNPGLLNEAVSSP